MRKLIRLVAIIITFWLMIFLWLNVHGQEISTVYEIYNYEIGDVFHFYAWGSMTNDGYSSYSNTEILNKYFSTTGDTLFYSQEVTSVYSDWEGTTYYNYIDTATITNLNSLINYGNIDSAYYDSALYNGRKINYKDWSIYPDIEEIKWVEGCGRAYKYRYEEDFPFDYLEEEIKLIYYLKGNEEWGEPFFVEIPEIINNNVSIKIYPNPTKEKIYISINGLPQNEAEIFIYSTIGNLVKFIRTNMIQNYQIDISYLPIDIYIIKIRFQNEVLVGKFIKE